jgi:hypothetical protein
MHAQKLCTVSVYSSASMLHVLCGIHVYCVPLHGLIVISTHNAPYVLSALRRMNIQ